MHAPLRLSTLLVLFLLACAQFTVALLSFPQVNTKREAQPGDGYGGAGFTVQALFDEQPATVIMLHGLGGNGREWAVLSLGLSIFSLNYVKFIIPSAENASVTYLNSIVMPSWYDILFIRGTVSEVDEDDLLKSVARVNRIIDGEIAAGVPADRIFLVGFSQGGGLALSAFLRSKTVLGGCIGVATWLPRHEDFETFGGDVNVSRAIQSRDVQMIHVSCITTLFFFSNARCASLFCLPSVSP